MHNHMTAHNQTLLLIDDEPAMLSALKRTLRGEGWRIISVRSAQEALAVLSKEPVDVVLTDYRMPDMDGIALCQEIHRIKPDVVRILISGYTQSLAVAELIHDKALYHYISKPWDDWELKQLIAHAMEKRALEKENVLLKSTLKVMNKPDSSMH